ncbi:hypothetical protein F4703DRAFT_1881495 [Phycomyces blakesleeanus]
MLLSELPFEILSKIADILINEDKASCTLVCKRWKFPFQDSLWKNIEVKSMEQLTSICDIVKHSTNGLSFSLAIQNLYFTSWCTITDLLQSNILQVLPNLKHLNLGDISFKTFDTEISIYGGPWKSLVSLEFQVCSTREETSQSILVEFLTQFPNLHDLNIFPCFPHTSIYFDVSNINTIHKYLSRLRSIKGAFTFPTICQSDIQTIPKAIPAYSLTSLDIHILNLNSLWLYYQWLWYFSYKYPNLRTLTLKALCETDESIIKEYNIKKGSLLRPATTLFPHLETVEFNTEDFTKWSHTVLWDLLCQSNAPIKNLRCWARYRTYEEGALEKVIRQLVQSFSKTLETMSVEGYLFFGTENIVKLEISYCPRLVELEITDNGSYIELDNLLDNCIALSRLKFSNGKLNIGSDPHEKPAHHGLNILELSYVTVNTAVFSYLSFRCRSLEYMYLNRPKICDSISDETKRLYIDMSYTNFKVLRLDHIYCYSSDRLMDKNTAINLILLSQVNSDRLSNGTRQSEDIVSVVKHLSWFHVFYGLDHTFDSAPKVRKLSEQEVCITTEYYQNFRFRESTGIQESMRSMNGQTLKSNWKADLCRGYAEMRCGNIKNYCVPLL